MRRTVVFMSLLGMLGSVSAMAALREHPDLADALAQAERAEAEGEDGEAAPAEASATADGTTLLSAEGEASGEATAEGEAGEAEAEGEADTAVPVEPESLKVVALGWEVLAPGVLANGGMQAGEASDFREAGLDVTFSAVSDAEDVEVRLGRGGKDKKGADVALMPLPAFVASYERLRALSPQVFFVVGWSRGRDAMVGEADLLLHPPRGEVRITGEAGSSETLLTLFALDQAGVSPSRIKLVEGNKKKRASLEAVQRRKSRQFDARRLVMSTADATHLVPVVAVAPAGVVEHRQAALTRWSQVWMDGAQTLGADPADAARQLAAQKSAPEAVDLIDALGWLEFTDLHGAAEAAGLSGRGAVNLDALFHRTWDLWREVGLLTTPPPQRVPLNGAVIADLARKAPPAAPKPTRSADRDEADTMLVHTVPGRRLDAEAEAKLVSEVGLLAGVFSRSTLEVWIPRSPDAAERVAHHAAERFGLAEGRVVVRKDRDRKAGKAAVIKVRAAQ